MDRHEWEETVVGERIETAVARGEVPPGHGFRILTRNLTRGGEWRDWPPGHWREGSLCTEILRLAEELRRANASVGEANLEADRLRGDLAEAEAERDRLAEEVERLKVTMREKLSEAASDARLNIAAARTEGATAERSQIRRELLAELDAACGRGSARLIGLPKIKAALDRIAPEE